VPCDHNDQTAAINASHVCETEESVVIGMNMSKIDHCAVLQN